MKIKCLRSNRGGEFSSNEFNKFFEANGIKRQLTTPRTPKQCGISERRNRSSAKEIREMMLENNVSKTLL